MWTDVKIDYDGETINFGPRLEMAEGIHLYEACTLFTISVDGEPHQKHPSLQCDMTDNLLAINADKQVHVFTVESDDQELLLTLNLESWIDALALSRDSQLLALATRSGLVQIFHVEMQQLILSVPMEEKTENDAVCSTPSRLFQSIVFSPVDDAGNCSLMVLWKKLSIFYLNVTSLCLGFVLTFQAVLPTFKLQEVDLDIFGLCHSICHLTLGYCFDKTCVAILAGSGIYALEVSEASEPTSHAMLPDCCLEGYASKVAATFDNRYLFILTTKECLVIVCAATLTTLCTIDEYSTKDFVVMENADPNSGSVMNCHLVLLACDSTQWLHVLAFPSLEKLYSLEVCGYALLIQSVINQEGIYLVEGLTTSGNDADNVSMLRVRTVVEILPEIRLDQLLKKRKFSHAEEFARVYGLDLQIIYKAKFTYLLETLSVWQAENPSTEDINNHLEEIKMVIKMIEDVEYVVQCCLKTPLCIPSSLRWLLVFIQSHVQKVWSDELQSSKTDIRSRLNNTLNRLVTYEELFGKSDNWQDWFKFCNSTLLKEFISLLQHDESLAFCLWDRHQYELMNSLTPDTVEEILNSIQDTVSSSCLSSWLQSSFLPLVFQCVPEVLDWTVDWLINRARMLELVEKDKWPSNASDLLQGFLKVWHRMVETSVSGCRPVSRQFTLDLQATSDNSSVRLLLTMISDLEDLSRLSQVLHTYLSFSEFCQEDKQSVVFIILDHVNSSQVLESLLGGFLEKYIINHGLDKDKVFLQYIQETIQASPYTWWHWEEAPWEETLLVLTSNICNCESKIRAVLMIVSEAPVPWSPAVQKLMDEALSTSIRKEELENECRMVGLKRVLIKYKLKSYNINNPNHIKKLLNFILKQDSPTVVQDVMEVIKADSDLSQSDVYFQVTRALLQKNKVEEVEEFLSSISEDVAELTQRLTTYIELLLNESASWHTQESKVHYHQLIAGIVSWLLSAYNREKCDRESDSILKLQIMKTVLRLQEEFGIFVPLSVVQNASLRWNFLCDTATSFLAGNLSVTVFIPHEKKLRACSPTYSNLYRLADILGCKRIDIIGYLFLKAVRKGNMDTSLELIRKMISLVNSQDSAESMLSVIRSFCSKWQDNSLSAAAIERLCSPLYHLTACVVAFGGCELWNESLQLWHWFYILKQIEQGNAELESLLGAPKATRYSQWRLSQLYQDRGLRIDFYGSASIVSTCIKAALTFSASPTLEDLMAYYKLIQNLKTKGQDLLALQVIAMAIFSHLIPLETVAEEAKLKETLLSASLMWKDAIHKIFSRMVRQKKVDHTMGLGLIFTLEQDEVLQLIKSLMSRSTSNYRCIMALTSIMMEYAFQEKLPGMLRQFLNIYIRAQWGQKLSAMGITPEESLLPEAEQRPTLILKQMVHHTEMNVDCVQQYCYAFKIDVDEGLSAYLHALLLSDSRCNARWIEKTIKSCSRQLTARLRQLCETVVNHFQHSAALIECLQDIENKVDFYNYEVLEFIYHHMFTASVNDNSVACHASKALSLLKFLQSYRRISLPTRYEKDLWLGQHLNCSELPSVADKHLPFHLFLKGDLWKLVGPELSVATFPIWLNMSDLINMKPNELRMMTVKNTINQWTTWHQHIPSEVWVKVPPDTEFLTSLKAIILGITDLERAVACANWVMNQFPTGMNKILVAATCRKISKQWLAASGPTKMKAKEAFAHLTATYQNLTIKYILQTYDMGQEEYLAIAHNPELLIIRLLEGHSDRMHLSYKKMKTTEEAVAKIASVGCCNLSKIYESLFEQWLPPVGQVANSDESLTLNFHFDMLQGNNPLLADTQNEINIQRVIRLLQYGDIKNNALKLLNIATNHSHQVSASHRARALRCLVAIMNPETIKADFGWQLNEIKDLYKTISFVSWLEEVSLPYDEETFRLCNKEELAERVLATRRHDAHALQLVASLCVEFVLWNPHLWETIMNSMRNMFMIESLEQVLGVLGGVSSLWSSPSFIEAWNFVLKVAQRPVRGDMAEQSNVENHQLRLLIRCPCRLYLDLIPLARDFLNGGFLISSFVCLLSLPPSTDRDTFLKEFEETLDHLKHPIEETLHQLDPTSHAYIKRALELLPNHLPKLVFDGLHKTTGADTQQNEISQ